MKFFQGREEFSGFAHTKYRKKTYSHTERYINIHRFCIYFFPTYSSLRISILLYISLPPCWKETVKILREDTGGWVARILALLGCGMWIFFLVFSLYLDMVFLPSISYPLGTTDEWKFVCSFLDSSLLYCFLFLFQFAFRKLLSLQDIVVASLDWVILFDEFIIIIVMTALYGRIFLLGTFVHISHVNLIRISIREWWDVRYENDDDTG